MTKNVQPFNLAFNIRRNVGKCVLFEGKRTNEMNEKRERRTTILCVLQKIKVISFVDCFNLNSCLIGTVIVFY